MANSGVSAEAQYVWQLLTHARKPGEDGYFEHVRAELLDLFAAPLQHLVDIGCGTGLTGLEAKRRFPSARVDGFEYSEHAAAVAAQRLDRVHHGNVEAIDFAQAGYEPGMIDGLLLADVLEHLYNPWDLLVRIRPFLADDAQIVASIPNARNLVLLSDLAAGNFSYVPAGLLDITHIRFFTRSEIIKLFAETGYEIVDITGSRDGRIPTIGPPDAPVNLDTESLTFKNVDAALLAELTTIQFFVRARPRPVRDA